MDNRHLDNIKTKYDGIICGFCSPYLSQNDCVKVISNCYKLLKENGLIYLSFVEGDPSISDFQITSTGDRCYFYYFNLDELKKKLIESNVDNLKIFKVQYKKSESETKIHTILIANKKR